ncbi:MAG: S8 family serine peptidase [Eubacteriales bacterium]|nr:S8 family serine peptidase [Eubacteriales bacterium]
MIKHKRLCALITATFILVQIMSLPSFGTEPEVKASFDGSETVIAVLSGGFAGTDDGHFSAAGITGPLTGPIPGLEGRGIYRNARFPYVYDYAGGDTDIAAPDSTGTTLCGIIVSIVPAAQLVLMKVYDDGGAVDSEAVCAAMSDAFLLGVSVILLDIDEYAGTDDGSELEGDIAALIAEADGRGIPVVCSAGNNGRAGAYGIYQSYYGITHIPADKPDYGTVSAPSSVSSVLSVGSRESKTYSVPCISFGQNGKTAFSDTNADYGIAGPYTFTTFFNDMTFEYVPVGGTGTPEDCAAAGELNGKIALIRRGELTFVEKVNNAAGGGAAGVIIYDNIENNDAGVLMALEGAAIPAVFISYESGMAMLAETDRHVYIKEGETSRFPNPDGGRMSAFSSRGVTPSLEIKPELTAEGGSRDIILFDGALKESTGSDSLYAAAEITARIAALSGYLKSRGMDYNSEALKLALMNAASPIKDESGVEFSPRAQGAGAVENLMSVLNAGARLYDARGRGKLSLGEGLKTSFAVTFYAENISDTDMTYELSATMTGDDYTYFKVGDIGLAYESDEPESGFPAFIKENARPFKDASVTLSDVRRDTGNLNVIRMPMSPR